MLKELNAVSSSWPAYFSLGLLRKRKGTLLWFCWFHSLSLSPLGQVAIASPHSASVTLQVTIPHILGTQMKLSKLLPLSPSPLVTVDGGGPSLPPALGNTTAIRKLPAKEVASNTWAPNLHHFANPRGYPATQFRKLALLVNSQPIGLNINLGTKGPVLSPRNPHLTMSSLRNVRRAGNKQTKSSSSNCARNNYCGLH